MNAFWCYICEPTDNGYRVEEKMTDVESVEVTRNKDGYYFDYYIKNKDYSIFIPKISVSLSYKIYNIINSIISKHVPSEETVAVGIPCSEDEKLEYIDKKKELPDYYKKAAEYNGLMNLVCYLKELFNDIPADIETEHFIFEHSRQGTEYHFLEIKIKVPLHNNINFLSYDEIPILRLDIGFYGIDFIIKMLQCMIAESYVEIYQGLDITKTSVKDVIICMTFEHEKYLENTKTGIISTKIADIFTEDIKNIHIRRKGDIEASTKTAPLNGKTEIKTLASVFGKNNKK